MKTRFVLFSTLLSAAVAAQTGQETLSKDVARLANGQPNMQGIWFFGSKTPYERPLELGTKRFYTVAEAQAVERSARTMARKEAQPIIPDRNAPPAGAMIDNGAETAYEDARTRLALINGEHRTSLLIDPEDGQLPYRQDAMDMFDEWRAAGGGEFDGPEVRPPSERCVNGVGQMPPMIGWKYNANMRIVQTTSHFVIAGETHSPRIIPTSGIDSRPGMKNWMGESVGRWDGDTLVVDTKNFRAASSFFQLKSSDQLQVTEYFSLVSDDEILYRYTVTDPKIYTRPFTVEMSITRRAAGENIYEWACHEANYSMRGILAGARRLESEN